MTQVCWEGVMQLDVDQYSSPVFFYIQVGSGSPKLFGNFLYISQTHLIRSYKKLDLDLLDATKVF